MPTFLSTTNLIPVLAAQYPIGDHITFNKPIGLQADDVLIFVAGSQGSISEDHLTVITPGWSTIGSFLGDDNELLLVAAYRMTGSEGSTITVTFSEDMDANELIACVIAYRNARIPTELVVGEVNISGSIRVNCPSQIPPNIGDFYIGIVHDFDNFDTANNAPGNIRYNFAANDGGLILFDFVTTIYTPTGDQTVTMNTGSGLLSAFSIVLRDSALSADEQAMIDHSRNSLPRWLTSGVSSTLEWLHQYKTIFDTTLQQAKGWIYSTYLSYASGAALNQHAIDRGTTRQNAESDSALRERLRNISDALTEPALLFGVDSILDSTGILAQFRVQQYVTTGWNTVFQAKHTSSNGGFQTKLTLSLVSDGTNPPTLVENSITGSTIIHFSAGVTTRVAVENLVNSSSSFFIVETNSSSPSTVLTSSNAFTAHNFYLSRIVGLRRDRGHMHSNTHCHAFASRGYRMTGLARPSSYIFILPFGTTAATGSSVGEYLRKNGPGGYNYMIERRLNP